MSALATKNTLEVTTSFLLLGQSAETNPFSKHTPSSLHFLIFSLLSPVEGGSVARTGFLLPSPTLKRTVVKTRFLPPSPVLKGIETESFLKSVARIEFLSPSPTLKGTVVKTGFLQPSPVLKGTETESFLNSVVGNNGPREIPAQELR